MVAICENIAIGEPICDSYQNIINKNLAERFLRVETMISSDEMNDMLTCDGTGQYEKRLLEVLAVNYYACAKHKELHDKIENESIWAAKAMRKYFDVDDNGELNWKKSYSTGKHRVLDVEGR
jgi:hypothetical protein